MNIIYVVMAGNGEVGEGWEENPIGAWDRKEIATEVAKQYAKGFNGNCRVVAVSYFPTVTYVID